MANAKKILITTESHETFVVRRVGRGAINIFCDICETETSMLTLYQAASIALRMKWNLMSLLEAGTVHSVETSDGQLLICLGAPVETRSSTKNGTAESYEEYSKA